MINTTQELNEAKLIFNSIKDISKIPELDFKLSNEYKIKSAEKILNPLIESHEVVVVAGAYFGDEGKGKTVDAIARHKDIKLIARVNSGENAGHTVYNNGKKFIFHLAPSGLFIEDKINVIGSECVMDPVSFMRTEITQLIEAGINYKEKLFIGNVHIVTPYHKLLDFIGNVKNSSTLKGMSPVHASKVSKKGLRLNHIFGDVILQKKILEKDMLTYFGLLKEKGFNEQQVLNMCLDLNKAHKRIPEHIIDFLKADDKIEYLINLYRKVVVENIDFPSRKNVDVLIQDTLEKGGKVLIEGPQSFYLSNAVKTHWNSSTSADTTSAGIKSAAGYNLEKFKAITINIHKTPASSRVGIGANPSGYVKQDFFSKRNVNTLDDLENTCDNFDSIQKLFFESVKENGILEPRVYQDTSGEYLIGAAMAITSSKKHGERGATTLKPRICGLFDCIHQYNTNKTQGPYLSISALDRGDFYDKIGLTIAYIYFHPEAKVLDSNGKKYRNLDIIKPSDPLPNENVLYFCHPIIKVIEGWKQTPIAYDKFDSSKGLPKQLQKFIGLVEHFTGSKIISIGNGPNTENLIWIEEIYTNFSKLR